MADNIQLNAGSLGDVLAADDVGGVMFQRVKVTHGTDGNAQDVSSTAPLPVADAKAGTVPLPFFRFLDTNGDGTGTKDAIGDYSVTQGVFKIAPAAGEVFRIHRLLVYIEDTAGMTSSEYGNLGSALPNGVQLRIHNGTSTVLDLLDGVPVTVNGEWGGLCYDVALKSWGAGNDVLLVRWTFTNAGAPLRLDGDATEELQVLLDDNLTGLIHHRFQVQGFQEGVIT
jgi:hypothetical protein